MFAPSIAASENPTITGAGNQPSTSLSIAWLFGGLAILLHVALATRYDYFREELYYLACSDHLAAGYVDLAPLSACLLHINRVLFGDSLHALRLLPAFAFGAEVVLSGYVARELGARRWGIFLGCASVLSVPVFGSQADRYSMNAFEPLFWMGCIYVLLLVLNLQKPRLLLWCGVLLGLGLENKHSTVFFLGALLVGLLQKPFPRIRTITIGARAGTRGNPSFFFLGISRTRNIGAAQSKRVLKMRPTMGWAGSTTPFSSAATSRFRLTKPGHASKPGTRC